MNDPFRLHRLAHRALTGLRGCLESRRSHDPDPERWNGLTRATRRHEDAVLTEAEQTLQELAKAARGRV